jgi:ubiquinone/menaquinone biosynthesis C-methylase UbiE
MNMNKRRTAPLVEHESSTGHIMASADWLDLHFTACRPEYETIVRAAGFQRSWRILDVGCGSGSFLPSLAEIVGPAGRLAALDLAEENIEAINARLAAHPLACPVQTRIGSATALPYLDDYFDGVWCAAVLMYLPDDALLPILAELRRVVRPGGLVAVKDYDSSLGRMTSRNPYLLPHLNETAAAFHGVHRGPDLRAWLRRAGLEDVRLTHTLVEHWAPLTPAKRAFLTKGLAAFAGVAAGLDLPEAEQAEWAEILADPGQYLDTPDFLFREGHVLAVGRVPERG